MADETTAGARGESAESAHRQVVRGVGASGGIAIGRVTVLHRQHLAFERVHVKASRIRKEQQRFEAAIERSLDQLRSLKGQVEETRGPSDHFHILEAHELMLTDEMLAGGTLGRIADERINAEWALEKTLEEIRKLFARLDDEVFRERITDVDFVGVRLMRNLLGYGCDYDDAIRPNHIVVAHNLSPAETVQMLHRNVLGLVTDVGSRTSHTAIVARALEVPAVVGLRDISERAGIGEMAILDGDEGVLILNPTKAELGRYRSRRARRVVRAHELLRNRELPAVTQDGVEIPLLANIDFREEVNSMFANGGCGVGLFRTEFLYLNRNELPDEEEQYGVYRALLEKVHPQPTTIRTLDLGGDKFVSMRSLGGADSEPVGLRAIRLCLHREDIFRVQLRALLRASVHGRLRILIPFVTCVSEIRRVSEIIAELKDELRAEGVPFDADTALGVMIETPAAVQIADLLAPWVDFFSIGTNDLIQYSMALARENPEVSYLYHPLHPAIIRMIRSTADAARRAGISSWICGEMASEPSYALVLIGLGLSGLSMVPNAVPAVKEVIRGASMEDARALVESLWELPTYQEVERRVLDYMHDRYPAIV